MSGPWRGDENKAWSDRFLPEIKGIIGTHLIGEAPIEEDMERNTDLVVLRLDAIRIACRVRRHSYLANFGEEFTLREGVPSGAKTELAKVLEGWGDYIFYGFSDEQEVALAAWILGDLKPLRLWFFRRLTSDGTLPGTRHRNSDGTFFRSFRVADLPAEFLVSGKAWQPSLFRGQP